MSQARPGAVAALYRHLMQGQWLAVGAYFALLLVALGLQVPVPFLLSGLVDNLTKGAPFPELAPRMLGVIGLSLTAMLMSTATQIFSARLNVRFLLNARLSVYRALQRAPLRFSRTFNTSDLQARFMGDMGVLQHFLPTGIANVARHLLCVVVFGLMLIYISPAVVVLIVWLLPVAGGVFWYAKPRMTTLAAAAHANHARSNATVLESLSGLRECRITGSHEFHHARLHASLNEGAESVLRVRTYSAYLFGGLGLIPIIVTALIWLVGGWQISTGGMSMGELISFMLVLSLMYGPINGLFGVGSGYVYEREAFERVALLYEGAAQLPPAAAMRTPVQELVGPVQIELRDLGFAYGSEPVFEGVQAVVAPGTCVSIVGGNGAGKSTLVSILCGLEAPTSGSVHINGAPFDSLGPDYLPRHFGYLPQDIMIFGDTLRMNISMGRKLPDERLQAAFSELGLAGFLDEWPDGLDSMIEECGRNLSGGQKQKIALLRAVAGEPSMLMLDEPENNLDTQALAGLVAYLARAKERCTVLLVTHGDAFDSLLDGCVNLSPVNFLLNKQERPD